MERIGQELAPLFSLNQPSERSSALSVALGIWHFLLGRKGRAYYIRLMTRIPLQQFTVLSGYTLVPQLFELRGIVKNFTLGRPSLRA
jgi:hypothetical protein